jgi:hypothetical protein
MVKLRKDAIEPQCILHLKPYGLGNREDEKDTYWITRKSRGCFLGNRMGGIKKKTSKWTHYILRNPGEGCS